MKKIAVTFSLIALFLMAYAGINSFFKEPGLKSRAVESEVNTPSSFENFSQLPLHFETNVGQVDDHVKYLSRGEGYSLFLTQTGAVLSLVHPRSEDLLSPESALLSMRLVGANPDVQILGFEEQAGKANYIIGNDPAKWHTNIPTYAEVRYADIYSGVDLIYYGKGNNLEYDFVVAPGIDPSTITLSFDGVQGLKVDRSGNLVLSFDGGEIQMQKPIIYQDINGARQAVQGGYGLSKNRDVRFKIESYDQSKPLRIDPVLIYSSYFGGFSDDDGMGIALDSSDNIYIVGPTTSTNFPMTTPFQSTYGGGIYDGFVVKLNPAGTTILYSTYIGGSDEDTPTNIAVDSFGNAYIVGYTRSTNFPTQNPLQASNDGESDAFVAKLSANGAQLLYSTYLGGNAADPSADILLDSGGNILISGQTQSSNFPIANALQPNKGGDADAFLAKLDLTSSTLVYSTYIGGTENDSGDGIAVDATGNAFLMGTTLSTNFPVMDPLQAVHASPGLHDAFLAKVSPTGNLLFSTFLGGDNEDGGNDVAIDSDGNAYVTGHTYSSNFPAFAPSQSPLHGSNDAFVAKINSAGTALIYATLLGGSSYDNGRDITVGNDGSAYVTGDTDSTDFPLVDPIQPEFGGGIDPGDAFVTKLDPGGTSLSYSTYLGGSGSDRGRRIIVDSGVAYVTGLTQSDNFPLKNPFQNSLRGVSDAFIVKICAPRFTVTSTADSGPGSLRQAIKDVCPGGTIDFNMSFPATITLSTFLQLDKDLTISGPGVDKLTISGNGTTSIFYNDYSNPKTISISSITIANANNDGGIYNFGNLTIENVTFSNNQTTGTGGGLHNGYTGTVTVTDSEFIGNHTPSSVSAYGGGIYNEGTLDVTNSKFSENIAGWGGSGIANSGVLMVSDSIFSGNSTPNAGAGIYNFGAATIDNVIFSANNAHIGGGISSSGTLSILNSTFSDNTAAFIGGGVDAGGLTTIRSSTFINNDVTDEYSWGGGIANWGNNNNLTVSNSTIVGNNAALGGGLYNTTNATLINNTFSENSASQSGGAVYNAGTLIFSNNILANSLLGVDCYNNGGTIATNKNNLVENNSTTPNNCGIPTLSSDPQLGTMTNNTGSTQTMPLLAGSPAIDAADDATCAASPVNNLDQRGVTRLLGLHCDIGAYEYQSSPHLVLTYVPPYGTPVYPAGRQDILTGQANNVSSSDYHVVCYIYVPESVPYGENGWWIKPHDYVYNNHNLWESPIQPDNTWECDIATGGYDPKATVVEAYLVPEAGKPSAPPTRAWLISNAVAKAVVTRNPLSAIPWPMYGHDASHSGYSPSNGPNSADLLWSYALGERAQDNASPVVGLDGTIYMPTEDGFFAVNPDRTLKWSKWANQISLTRNSPAIAADGTIYVTRWPGDELFALDPSDGTTLWSYAIGGASYGSPTIGSDGTIYIGNKQSPSSFYALNPDGTLKWRWDSGSSCWIESSAAIGPNGDIYFQHNCLGLVSLSASGQLNWIHPGAGDAWNSPSIGLDGTIYMADSDHYFYAFNPDGTLKWRAPVQNTIYKSSSSISPDGSTIYQGDNGGIFYAFNSTGSVKWQYDTGVTGTITSAPALTANGIVYFTHAGGHIYALRAVDGSLLWQYNIGASSSSPSIGNDGTLYVTGSDESSNSVLYAFECADKLCEISNTFHILDVNKTGLGSGTVTSSPVGITCGSDCSESYASNTVVTLATASDPGSVFAGWSGDPDCLDGQVTMDASKMCTAAFDRSVLLLGFPSGILTTWDRSFHWTGVSGATWYELELQTAGGIQVFDLWYTTTQAGCDNGTACAVTPAEAENVAIGNYQCRIRDYGEYGYGTWTEFQTFTPPAALVLGEPSGMYTNWDHSFHWTGLSAATYYYVVVETSAGTPVFDAWYTSAEAGCEGGTSCAITPSQALHMASRDYRWRVLDYGGYGYGSWTSNRSFSLDMPPATAGLGEPTGTETNWDHSFHWNGFTDSTWYYLVVQTSGGTTVFDAWYTNAEAGCGSGTSCTIAPIQALHLVNGAYQWKILDYGPYGYGSWTALQSFTLSTPPVGGIPGAPSGTLTSWDHTFNWTGFPDSSWYFLQVQKADGTAVFDAWYTNGQSGCEGDTSCVIAPAQALRLANGDYRWRILDYGSYGYGSWTPFQSFTLNIAPPVVVLGAPKNTLTSWDGSYQWTGIPDGTWYLLEVQNNQGSTILSQWYSASGNCTDLACVATPDETLGLPNGSYQWRILYYSSTYGYGSWTTLQPFTLSR
jgi:outer membrane protein assembly factor BamB